MLTFDEFQNANEKRCIEGFKHNLKDWSFMEWGSATAGKVGEANNVAKKIKRIQQNISGNKEGEDYHTLRYKMGKEIMDGIIYSFLWLSAAGFNAEEMLIEVFNAKSDDIGSNIKI